MKRTFFLCLLVFCLAFCAIHLPAQTSLTAFPNTGTSGQTITMAITGVGVNFTTATGATLSRVGNDYPSSSYTITSPTQMTATFNIPAFAMPGYYSLQVQTAIQQNAFYMNPGPGSNYSLISGRVISDLDNNCVIGGADHGLPNQIVSVVPGNHWASTDSNGYYEVWVPNDTFTITSSLPAYSSLICPVGGTHDALFPPSGSYQDLNNNFFVDTINYVDLVVHASMPIVRPGFTQTHYVTAVAAGTLPAQNVVMVMVLDSHFIYNSANPVPNSVNGDTLTWNVGTLQSPQTFAAQISTTLPPATPLGTVLTNILDATTTSTEVNSNDNTRYCTGVVVGSYDPNDKQVFNYGGQSLDGFYTGDDSIFEYLIRFQNTGTDTAFNIIVRDTLDPSLDVSTLKVLQYSHNVQMQVNGAGNVSFLFPNILLLDSNANEPLSHGFIRYSIRPKAGLPLGTTITNTGFIYFDYNAPVVTNTTASTHCPELSPGFSFTSNQLTVQFSDSSSGLVDSLWWDFGDGNTALGPNPSHTYSADGIYTVCQYVSNSCGRLDSNCVIVAVQSIGIADPGVSSFAVFPNPSEGRFGLDLELLKPAMVSFEVMDMQGRTVVRESMGIRSGNFSANISLEGHSKGIYLLRVLVGGQTLTKKLEIR